MTAKALAQRGRGRPTTFRKEIADQICERLMEGESLRAICREEAMPPASTVMTWALRDEQGFFKQYAMAREIQAWGMFDDLIDIADDSRNDYIAQTTATGETKMVYNAKAIQRARLQVKTRMWILTKVLPKTFG